LPRLVVLHSRQTEKAPDFSGAFMLSAGRFLNQPGKRGLVAAKDGTGDQHTRL